MRKEDLFPYRQITLNALSLAGLYYLMRCGFENIKRLNGNRSDPLTLQEAVQIKNKVERKFGLLILERTNLTLYYQSVQIALEKPLRYYSRRLYIPDFIVCRNGNDPLQNGTIVEVTSLNQIARHFSKEGQLAVVKEAGLSDRFALVTLDRIEAALRAPKQEDIEKILFKNKLH